MADDLFSEVAQLGGAVPGWAALLAFAAVALRLGRHIGAYEKTQDGQEEENERLRKAVGKVDTDLVNHKQKTDERFASHAEALTETRLALAKLPDRDEIRAQFDQVRADINRRAPPSA